MLKDELVDWIPGSVAGAWPLVGAAAVDDEVFGEFAVCSRDSSCERSRVRNLS